MKNLITYKMFESAPRIPRLNERGSKYWLNKGKSGNDVMIYTHDDMDGIFSAIAVKSRLNDLGYNIIGYGILNYMDSWKTTEIDPTVINVAVDFAQMPNDIENNFIDIYIDHHGEYTSEEKETFKKNPVIKTKTGSAYEGICRVIGKPIDEILLYSIDMIDSAKYDDYLVDWRDILDFSWDKFIEISNRPGKVTIKPFKESKSVTFGYPIIAKLTFAGAFNQFLKRSDHKTVIEVIDNVNDPSIYAIYNAMKKIYPGNNIWTKGENKGKGKDFIEDSKWRIEQMKIKTRGVGLKKQIFNSQQEFIDANMKSRLDGYQIIGNLMFVPSGTWANALRARSILLKDRDSGIVPEDHDVNFIMLQYGNTIQVCSVNKIEEMENLPILINNVKVDNLGNYMDSILLNFKKYFGYYDNDTKTGQDELTVSGGHVGIGTISNIVGRVDIDKIKNRNNLTDINEPFVIKYSGMRYLDLIKNKIISDLSGLSNKWNINMSWVDDVDVDEKSVLINDIIKNNRDYKLKIDKIYSDSAAKKYDKKYTNELVNNMIKNLKNELSNLDIERLRELKNQSVMNKKVMLKKDIRRIDTNGNI